MRVVGSHVTQSAGRVWFVLGNEQLTRQERGYPTRVKCRRKSVVH